MSKIIGIDLGTTKSCVAVIENGKPVIIKNAEGEMTTPSVVAFSKAGERLVGESAKRQAVTNKEKTFFSFKRDIGTDNSYNIDGKEYFPWQVYAMLLKKLKVDAESYLGEQVTYAVITVPTYFDSSQRQEIVDAARLAGLNVTRIISDSAAAALTYGINSSALDGHEESGHIMIYDLGGGNFNFAIFDISDGVVETLTVGGDPHLGGDDFDNRVVQWMVEEFRKEEGEDISLDKMALQRLKEAAEKAKKELSSVTATDIHIPFFAVTRKGVRHFDGVLTRAKFDEITGDLVEKTIKLAQKAMKEADLTNLDLKQVLLVGGSTRIPAVQEKVRQLTGKGPGKLLSMDEYVAIGASIQCGKLAGDAMAENILLMDVIAQSLAIETKDGVATRLIERCTAIPTKHSRIFSTTEDNQKAIDIKIVQGESLLAKDNKLLGQFRFDGIMPAKKGEPQIEITFDIDANGILNVSVNNLDTGKVRYETLPIPMLFWDKQLKSGTVDAYSIEQKEGDAGLGAISFFK